VLFLVPMWILAVAIAVVPDPDTGYGDGTGVVLALVITLVMIASIKRRIYNAGRSNKSPRRRHPRDRRY
jgi:hypothetical protein